MLIRNLKMESINLATQRLTCLTSGYRIDNKYKYIYNKYKYILIINIGVS